MVAKIERLWRRLQPLATKKMPLDVLPPRTSRFGSPLVLSTMRVSASDAVRASRRAESALPTVDRRRQRRDHRARLPRAHRVAHGSRMKAAQSAARETERRFPVRIRIAVPDRGLGERLNQMQLWFDQK